jgi:hypothetical protein
MVLRFRPASGGIPLIEGGKDHRRDRLQRRHWRAGCRGLQGQRRIGEVSPTSETVARSFRVPIATVRVVAAAKRPSHGHPDLTIQNRGGAQREVALRRSVAREASAEPRPPTVAELEPGTSYFDLDRATEDDLRAALPQLAEAQAVIFDLRGYPRSSSSSRI